MNVQWLCRKLSCFGSTWNLAALSDGLETRRKVETAIFQCINGFYNPRRRHSALGGKSRVAFERKVA
jgi:transposase InsO family protein